MAWTERQYSLQEVDTAGQRLIEAMAGSHIEVEDSMHPMNVIENWRAAHAFPLNTFQVYLRRKAGTIDKTALVAQRIKRLASIFEKLRRLTLRLSGMQDIGGCRAIVNTVYQVDALVQSYKESRIKHKLVHEDDYVRHPK